MFLSAEKKQAVPGVADSPAHRRPEPNRTGIPAPLRSRFEAVSGFSMGDVRVHYGSPKPAQLQALAYTQGSQVYLGPGQERHLPHELGHVVQQKRGIVRPNRVLGRTPVNTSQALEREADRIACAPVPAAAREPLEEGAEGTVVQRKVGFEFQTVGGDWNVLAVETQISPHASGLPQFDASKPRHGEELTGAGLPGIKVTTDSWDLEYITANPADERGGLGSMVRQVNAAGVKHLSIQRLDPDCYAVRRGKSYPAIRSERVFNTRGFLINPKGMMAAHPQATVGVKKERLFELMRRVTDICTDGGTRISAQRQVSGHEGEPYYASYGHTTFSVNVVPPTEMVDTSRLAQSQQNALAQAVNIAENSRTSAEAKGMIALLEHLILVNVESHTTAMNDRARSSYQTNAKNKMPVMPRTSPADLFQHLTPTAQDEVINHFNAKYIPTAATVLMEQADGEQVTLQEVIEHFKDIKAAAARHSPPRLQDPVEHSPFHGVGDAADRIAGSQLEAADSTDIGYDPRGARMVHGALVELRALPNNVAPDQWGQVVRVVGTMMTEINNPQPLTSLQQRQRRYISRAQQRHLIVQPFPAHHVRRVRGRT